jgi:hypothetical protein
MTRPSASCASTTRSCATARRAPSTTPGPYGAARYVRIDGGNPDAEDRYSALKDTTIRAGFKGTEPQWPAAGEGDAMARGMAAAAEIEREIANAGDDVLVLRRSYSTQSADASAMEADNGNVWYERGSGVLHALIATQSPHEVAELAAHMVSKSKFALEERRSQDRLHRRLRHQGPRDLPVLLRARRPLWRGAAGPARAMTATSSSRPR